jgi:hypothetical protein
MSAVGAASGTCMNRLAGKIKKFLHCRNVPVYVAALASLSILATQVSLHLLAKSSLIEDTFPFQQNGIAILYNLEDSVSYASWAYQAKLGHFLFLDLFTTEAHSGILFNLYFLIVGVVSRVADIDPISLMGFSSFLIGPVLAFGVLAIMRELKFEKISLALGVILVLCGSGLSGLFGILRILGVERFCHFSWLSELLIPGADAEYLDLFPSTSLAVYPYHAAALAFLALIVAILTKILVTPDWLISMRVPLLLGTLIFAFGLARPYETMTLAVVFNLTMLLRFFASRQHWKRGLAICIIINFGALPTLAYSSFVATRPVWNNFAYKGMTQAFDASFFLKGFGILWILAASGMIYAVADRNKNLYFFAIWTVLSVALLCVSPGHGSKLAGSSVIPDGVLAAYGVGRLIQKSGTTAKCRALMWMFIGIIGLMLLTPIGKYIIIVETGAPHVDTDLLAAGKRIRVLEGMRIPVVLTDLEAGAVLPGLFGERVFAGHWSLTPNIRDKYILLIRAGIEGGSPLGRQLDQSVLDDLIRSTQAKYMLLKRTAPAAQVIATCTHSAMVYNGDRWIAVDLTGWYCQ